MFDIGWGELLLVGMVALIVLGPKELPTVMRTLGHWMGRIRRMAAEFQGQFQEAMREAELDELRKQADSLSSSVSGMADPLSDVQRDVERALDTSELDKPSPAPDSAATPAEAGAETDQTAPATTVPVASDVAPAADDDGLAAVEPQPKQAGRSA